MRRPWLAVAKPRDATVCVVSLAMVTVIAKMQELDVTALEVAQAMEDLARDLRGQVLQTTPCAMVTDEGQ